jgi:hypothetical protein
MDVVALRTLECSDVKPGHLELETVPD